MLGIRGDLTHSWKPCEQKTPSIQWGIKIFNSQSFFSNFDTFWVYQFTQSHFSKVPDILCALWKSNLRSRWLEIFTWGAKQDFLGNFDSSTHKAKIHQFSQPHKSRIVFVLLNGFFLWDGLLDYNLLLVALLYVSFSFDPKDSLISFERSWIGNYVVRQRKTSFFWFQRRKF